jgi:hypothetical protein
MPSSIISALRDNPMATGDLDQNASATRIGRSRRHARRRLRDLDGEKKPLVGASLGRKSWIAQPIEELVRVQAMPPRHTGNRDTGR